MEQVRQQAEDPDGQAREGNGMALVPARGCREVGQGAGEQS